METRTDLTLYKSIPVFCTDETPHCSDNERFVVRCSFLSDRLTGPSIFAASGLTPETALEDLRAKLLRYGDWQTSTPQDQPHLLNLATHTCTLGARALREVESDPNGRPIWTITDINKSRQAADGFACALWCLGLLAVPPDQRIRIWGYWEALRPWMETFAGGSSALQPEAIATAWARVLPPPGQRQTAEQWQIEREDIITKLREVCGEFGDNDWKDDLHITDVLEKHLLRCLWEAEEQYDEEFEEAKEEDLPFEPDPCSERKNTPAVGHFSEREINRLRVAFRAGIAHEVYCGEGSKPAQPEKVERAFRSFMEATFEVRING